MSARFITVTLDDGGQVVINLEDVISIGPGHGTASGARIVMRRRVLEVQDSYRRLCDILRAAGVLEGTAP